MTETSLKSLHSIKVELKKKWLCLETCQVGKVVKSRITSHKVGSGKITYISITVTASVACSPITYTYNALSTESKVLRNMLLWSVIVCCQMCVACHFKYHFLLKFGTIFILSGLPWTCVAYISHYTFPMVKIVTNPWMMWICHEVRLIYILIRLEY